MRQRFRSGRCFLLEPTVAELDWIDVVLRLTTAGVVGGALGVNRFLHHKNIGVRTLGLVSITAAAVVAGAIEATNNDGATRAIQGIITGIGFIGAGVIVRQKDEHNVRGLTTAATVWVAASIGILCGLGTWRILLVATALVAILLWGGGSLEKWIVRQRVQKPPSDD